MLRVAINGYGRIGRIVHRQLVKHHTESVEVVAINAGSDAEMRAYLLKYDTLHGRFDAKVEVDREDLKVNNKKVKVVRERDPEQCPWKNLKVDLVVEATGKFRDRPGAEKHLKAGAKSVLITAPPKDDVQMIVRGVNDDLLDSSMPIISAASCTTNSIGPVVKVLEELTGVERGLMCTTHSYTSSQNILDNSTSSSKVRIARAAALNIIPSTTGAAKAIGKVFPHLAGKMDGMALRIPMPDVSATYLALELKGETTVEEIHTAMREASENGLRGILAIEEGKLVSSDYVTDPHSCTIDMDSTMVIGGNMVQLLSWYDNEWGYGTRVTELVEMMGEAL